MKIRFVAAALGSLLLTTADSPAEPRGFGYTSEGQLFSFDLFRPSAAVPIGGPVGSDVRGLDVRPGTSTLYALDVGPSTSQVYTVDFTTGTRTAVGLAFPNTGTVGPASYSLDPGAIYGFDFNPTTLQADGSIRIRVVNTSGADLRLNSDSGQIAAVDGTLQYEGGSPTPAISAAGYTNADTARATGTAPTTQLYYVDTANDNLVTFVPPANPNSGVFTAVGPIGFDVATPASLDIFAGNGVNKAFASLSVAGSSTFTLQSINLATGGAISGLGNFAPGLEPGAGFTVIDVPEPALSGVFGFSYNASGQLFAFDVNSPGLPILVGSPQGPGTVGVSFQPGTNTLFALVVGTAGATQLYSVDIFTGRRTAIGSGFPNSGTAPAPYTLDPAAAYGFDFNPTTLQSDGSLRIRLVNSSGADLRLNSATGAIAAVDGTPAYVGGNPASISVNGAAYTNSDSPRASGVGAGTLLFYGDVTNDNLVNLPTDPNSGQVRAVGPFGVDIGRVAGFDILYANSANLGFVAVGASGSGTYTFHRINLVTGAPSAPLGTFPGGYEPLGGVAIASIPGYQPTVDVTVPKVKITNPATRNITSVRTRIPFRGTASDNVSLSRVEVKVGSRGFRKATGTERWTYNGYIPRGTNAVFARSVDSAGNVSRLRRVLVTRP